MVPPAPKGSLSGVITSEDKLVERPGLDLLVELGWTHADLFSEEPGPSNPTGRQSFRELVLPARLRAALRMLNPSLPDEAIQQAELVLTVDRSAMLSVAANREVYRLLRDGIVVQVRESDGFAQGRARRHHQLDQAPSQRLLPRFADVDRKQPLQTPAGCHRFRQRRPAVAD